MDSSSRPKTPSRRCRRNCKLCPSSSLSVDNG
jgi:hypothetical protein